MTFSDIKVTHSTVLTRDGKPFVAVMFERGQDIAEGGIPECVILNNNGFSSREVKELEDFMVEYKKDIIDAAKGISTLANILR